MLRSQHTGFLPHAEGIHGLDNGFAELQGAVVSPPAQETEHYSPTNPSVLLELHPGYTVPGLSMKQCDQQMTMFK